MSNPPEPNEPTRSDQAIPIAGVEYNFAHTRPAPTHLFHYTTVQAAISILSENKIWATHVRYLNDFSEWFHVWDLAIQEIASIEGRDAGSNRIRGTFLDVIETVKHSAATAMPAFVASFCEDGDLLSQWRGYGSSGVSLGFNYQKMTDQHTNQESDYEIVPLEYETEHIEQRARNSFALATRRMFEEYRGAWECDENEIRRRLMESTEWTRYLAGLAIYAGRFKHESFKEENEWRAIRSAPMSNLIDELHFRNGGMGLTPYVELDVADQATRRPLIEKIYCAPSQHQSETMDAINLFLLQSGYSDHIEVMGSKTPFRDW